MGISLVRLVISLVFSLVRLVISSLKVVASSKAFPRLDSLKATCNRAALKKGSTECSVN